MVTGIFGGSFDPLHFGHLFLSLQIAEAHQLDRVLVCPAFCSPFKSAAPPIANPHHRLAMVKLAVADIPGFETISIEIDRGGPSYTIDTIRALPTDQYRLILSEEAAMGFHNWKGAEELLHAAPPLIGCRRGFKLEGPLRQELEKGLTLTRSMDISSTHIRERLSEKLYCGHLVPAQVLEYIYSCGLYL